MRWLTAWWPGWRWAGLRNRRPGTGPHAGTRLGAARLSGALRSPIPRRPAYRARRLGEFSLRAAAIGRIGPG